MLPNCRVKWAPSLLPPMGGLWLGAGIENTRHGPWRHIVSRNDHLSCFIFQNPYFTLMGELQDFKSQFLVASPTAGVGCLNPVTTFPVAYVWSVQSFCKYLINACWVLKLLGDPGSQS